MQVPEFLSGNRAQGPSSTVNVGREERVGSLAGGAVLMLAALSRRDQVGGLLGVFGALLLYRGLTGHSFLYQLLGQNTAVRAGDRPQVSVPHKQGVRVEKSFTVDRPVEEVYAFWRDFENLPRFMQHLESVEVKDDKRSHWVAKAPAGMSVEWDAEIVNEVPNEVIGWRSVESSQVANAGSVRFREAPGGRGTYVDVDMEYVPPADVVGNLIARLFGEAPDVQVESDLRRFKQIMEAGEVPTTEGQPSGPRPTRVLDIMDRRGGQRR